MRLSKIHHSFVAALCLLSAFFCAAQEPAPVNEISYISFAVPGALGTYPTSVNGAMEVAGYYLIAPMVARGFLRNADGAITVFNVAGSLWTEPESMNASGDITGFYEVVPGVPHGFMR